MSRTKISSKSIVVIDGNSLKLEDVEKVAAQNLSVQLSQRAYKQISKSRKCVEAIITENKPVYGITTGFGKFKDISIDSKDSKILQHNLILSHAAGVGESFDQIVVRAILLLRINALAKGFSGVRLDLIELLIALLNKNIHPFIPIKGSLGASGDLAPLAHLALVLIGEGHAYVNKELLPAAKALLRAKLKPLNLEAKEGLALTNGTQVMAALGALTLLNAERLAKVADIIGAMSLEAQLGSARAFNADLHKARPHPGQIKSASNLRKLLKDSSIMHSHVDCSLVQDAYSLRCMPQVHGASRQTFEHVRSVLEIEINSATDNPLLINDVVQYGGNFHGQPLALALDYLAIALAELANISERRTERLVNPALSNGLPAFLTENGGLNSGYMIAQYTAASLVSENKVLAHPASVDSIPTSANQEDHVSMGAISARKAFSILDNLNKVLAIELICAAQGLDFRIANGNNNNKQLLPGKAVLAAYKLVRKKIPHLKEDRQVHLDINAAEMLIKSGELIAIVEKTIGKLN
jgi:histidine ammonia-lyase